jgi:hypothetical protein
MTLDEYLDLPLDFDIYEKNLWYIKQKHNNCYEYTYTTKDNILRDYLFANKIPITEKQHNKIKFHIIKTTLTMSNHYI